MRFYLAVRFGRLDEINSYAEQLRQLGHTVNCRWLQGLHQLHSNAAEIEASKGNMPMEAMPFAQDDIEDIINCDTLILFSELPESHSKRGGRHVEFGLALGLGKHLVVIGPRENVFHCLPQVRIFKNWQHFMKFDLPTAKEELLGVNDNGSTL